MNTLADPTNERIKPTFGPLCGVQPRPSRELKFSGVGLSHLRGWGGATLRGA